MTKVNSHTRQVPHRSNSSLDKSWRNPKSVAWKNDSEASPWPCVYGAQELFWGPNHWGAKEAVVWTHIRPSSFSLKGKNAGKIDTNSTRNQKFRTSPSTFGDWAFDPFRRS
ncbi:unnamed protein product [Pleuronectes platessa]|uniref:Uncharacterized protein n=1 Tax=Pleuronectes platessa TaxID=8262 RepID=A0A9N7URN4_PLEPL|nr:unnamed protein product [Pleuronectes platessa]